MRPTLVVFVKAARAGRVKTRLGRGIGMTAAAWWYRHATRRLLRRLRDRRWRMMLAVSPDGALTARDWPGGLPRVAQGRGDLGRRMARAIRRAGPGPVVLVGSDVPALGRRDVAAALRRLGPARSVIGPAGDGGYWLVGYRNGAEARAAHFAGVRFSGPHALADTAARLPWPVARAHRLDDVDDADDLPRGAIAAMVRDAIGA